MTKTAIVLLLLASALPAGAQSGTQSPLAPSTVDSKPLAFEAVTIRPHDAHVGPQGWMLQTVPNGYSGQNISLYKLVQEAYGIFDPKLVTGGPAWIDTDKFDLQAKFDPSEVPNAKDLPYRQRADMLRAVLAERFQLKVHFVTKEFPAYNLVIAEGGSKLIETKPEDVWKGLMGPGCLHQRGDENFNTILVGCRPGDMDDLLLYQTGRTVIDKTGLTARYDIKLRYAPVNVPIDSPLASRPTIFKALQEQLGLKLEPGTAPLQVLVIDSAQPLTAN